MAQHPIPNIQPPTRIGVIAGNGKFPFLVIEGAHKAGVSVAVAAIREEKDPAL